MCLAYRAVTLLRIDSRIYLRRTYASIRSSYLPKRKKRTRFGTTVFESHIAAYTIRAPCYPSIPEGERWGGPGGGGGRDSLW